MTDVIHLILLVQFGEYRTMIVPLMADDLQLSHSETGYAISIGFFLGGRLIVM